MDIRAPNPRLVLRLSTGERIRMRREARGMSRPVLAGLVGRSPDWLKKIENGDRRINSLKMLVELARKLGTEDIADLTGDDFDAPTRAWEREVHPAVTGVRAAMQDVSFGSLLADENLPVRSGEDLADEVRRLWLRWHTSPIQRSDVGGALPGLIRQAHASIRRTDGVECRRCRAATADLYRLVQRFLAHICEPELHALAVERGRALSEEADSVLSLAEAAWASSVGLCASGHYDDAARLADRAAAALLNACADAPSPMAMGTLGALQLEAAAAHGLAGREGDAWRYLDAAVVAAGRMPAGSWHLPSAFDRTNVEILAVIIAVSLHKNGEAVARARKIELSSTPSVVRRSRLLLECAQAHANRREWSEAVTSLASAEMISHEAIALIPWARTLADELAEHAPPATRAAARGMAARLRSVS